MRRSAWCICTAAGVAVLLLAAPAQGAFPGKNGKLAVESQGLNDYDIHVLNPDGTGRVNLTNTPSPSFERAPAWSPDGSKIAFTRGVQPVSDEEIWVMNADGSGQTNLTDSPGTEDFDATWSPDGTKIAFVSCCLGGGVEIHVMSADGSGRVQLTHGETDEMLGPAWSPDGSKIAFFGDDPLGRALYQLFVVNADGSDVTQITTELGASSDPDWSPDGSKLGFTRLSPADGGGFPCCGQVYVMNPDGTGQTQLTGPDEPSFEAPENVHPVWAPDGTRIAFSSNREAFGRFDVWTIDPDGASELQVTTSGRDGLGDWQPIPAPRRGDYKNASHYCRALRDFLGEAEFANRYANHGTCVSASH